jgi:hypothetical protein
MSILLVKFDDEKFNGAEFNNVTTTAAQLEPAVADSPRPHELLDRRPGQLSIAMWTNRGITIAPMREPRGTVSAVKHQNQSERLMRENPAIEFLG